MRNGIEKDIENEKKAASTAAKSKEKTGTKEKYICAIVEQRRCGTVCIASNEARLASRCVAAGVSTT